jgi:DNA end-binding protein Ku
MESFAADFTPENFEDEYQVELEQLIDAKLEKGDAVSTAETFGEVEAEAAGGGEVLDLMDALRKSVEKNRKKQPKKSKPA